MLWEMHALFCPPACKGDRCFRPLLTPTDRIDLRATIGPHAVWNATNVSSSEPLHAQVRVPIPAEVREGKQWSLYLRVSISLVGQQQTLAVATVSLVRPIVPVVKPASMLLEEDSYRSQSGGGLEGLAPADVHGRVPHFVYSSTPCLLRLTSDTTPHAAHLLPAGDPIGSAFDHAQRRYAPFFYVDTFPLLRRHAAPLSSNLSKMDPMYASTIVFLPATSYIACYLTSRCDHASFSLTYVLLALDTPP
ncbi:MAG: hypothetical protein SGPRY_009364 [Prymnesium sp.]